MGETPQARVIRFTCVEHDEIWSGAVWCQHDIDTAVSEVMDGHRQPYGRDCHASVTVDIIDPETMEPQSTETWRFYPVEQHG